MALTTTERAGVTMSLVQQAFETWMKQVNSNLADITDGVIDDTGTLEDINYWDLFIDSKPPRVAAYRALRNAGFAEELDKR